mmetsp:Transcript_17226/g.55920  ORF Transcript_17226/g.55920 Transcript_17226/m.55920 type:complete len:852 (-) Transcript_17226:375-2930(-)
MGEPVAFHQLREEPDQDGDFDLVYEQERCEDEDRDDARPYVPPGQLRENTPAKKRRVTKFPAGAWKFVKRLTGDHPELKKPEKEKPRTHCCIFETVEPSGRTTCCYALLRLNRSAGGSWNTTGALEHFRDHHPASEIGKAQNKKQNKSEEEKQLALDVAAGVSAELRASSTKRGTKPISSFFSLTSKSDKTAVALAMSARWYVYGWTRVSKRTFDDPTFREMNGAYYMLGGAKGGMEAPALHRHGLKHWVVSEFKTFVELNKLEMSLEYEAADGNQFGLSLHDGGTLKDHHKREAVGFSYVDRDWGGVHTVCLGMVPIGESTNRNTASLLKDLSLERMGIAYTKVVANVVQDRAAIGVAGELGYEEEGCDMHDISKITRSAIGDLTRSRNKKVINAFPEGQKIMKKAHDMAKYFSYGKRADDLLAMSKGIDGPEIRLKLDLNETRVTARHSLLHSELRLNRALKCYQLQHAKVPWKVTEKDWEHIAEFEAVMRITDTPTKLVQSESLYLGACAAALKIDMIAKLGDDAELQVVQLENVTKEPKMPREPVSKDDLSAVGRMCLERARLEAERRFCGNKTEEILDYCYKMNDREKIATLLDFRTVNCDHIPPFMAKTAKGLLQELYIQYGKRAFDYKQEKVAASGIVEDQQEEDDDDDDDAGLGLGAWDMDVDDDDDDDAGGAAAAATPCSNLEEELKKEFQKAWKAWLKHSKKIKWKTEFPGLAGLDLVEDLLPLDVSCLYKKIADDPTFGLLPKLARASRGSIGTLPAESFCERIISAANLILTEGNTLLGTEELDMLAVLRMNREYIEYLREKHADFVRQKKLHSGRGNPCRGKREPRTSSITLIWHRLA